MSTTGVGLRPFFSKIDPKVRAVVTISNILIGMAGFLVNLTIKYDNEYQCGLLIGDFLELLVNFLSLKVCSFFILLSNSN